MNRWTNHSCVSKFISITSWYGGFSRIVQ